MYQNKQFQHDSINNMLDLFAGTGGLLDNANKENERSE